MLFGLKTFTKRIQEHRAEVGFSISFALAPGGGGIGLVGDDDGGIGIVGRDGGGSGGVVVSGVDLVGVERVRVAIRSRTKE